MLEELELHDVRQAADLGHRHWAVFSTVPNISEDSFENAERRARYTYALFMRTVYTWDADRWNAIVEQLEAADRQQETSQGLPADRIARYKERLARCGFAMPEVAGSGNQVPKDRDVE